MNFRLLVLAGAACLGFAACNRSPSAGDSQREADEKRIAELRSLEERASQREADARAAQLEADRQRLAQDQAALDEEKSKLAQERAAIRDEGERRMRQEQDERRLAQREATLRREREREGEQREADRQEQARRNAPGQEQETAARKIDFFYDALDPYGDWMELDPYGYVWQPREARGGDWRPYTDGSWVYTDYGWTWKGNEPFGWATYHYGRWTRLRGRGWVWVPGSEWAPAWVSWRKSPEYVGWAPLPPEAHSSAGFNGAVDSYYDIGPASYTFVPVGRLGEPTYRGLIVQPERNITIVNQTENVTRMNYTTVDQRTVYFNRGPDLDQINSTSSRPIPRYRLERESDRNRFGRGTGSNAAVVAGDVMRILAPTIASAPRAAAPPAKVKEHVKTAEVERGWGSGGENQAVRAKFRQEATQAETQARQEPSPSFPTQTVRPVPVPATPVRTSGFGTSGRPASPASAVLAQPATPRPIEAATPSKRPTPPPRTSNTPAPAPLEPATSTPKPTPPGKPLKPASTPPAMGAATKERLPSAMPEGRSSTPEPMPPMGTPSKRGTQRPLGGPVTTEPGTLQPGALEPSSTPAKRPTPPRVKPAAGSTPRVPAPGGPGSHLPGGIPTGTRDPVDSSGPGATVVREGDGRAGPSRRGVASTPEPLSGASSKPRSATPGDGLPVISASTPRKGPPAPDGAPEPRKTIPMGTPRPSGAASVVPGSAPANGSVSTRPGEKPGAKPTASPTPPGALQR